MKRRVRVDHLTDAELEGLAAKYEAEGDALHAAELRRFRRLTPQERHAVVAAGLKARLKPPPAP